MTSLQLGGYDPLDAQLDEVTIAPAPRAGRAPSRLPLARWSASTVPVASLLLAGMVLGPRGLGVLSSGTLALLDPTIQVALAALATLVGMGLDVRRAGDPRSLTAAVIAPLIAAAVVAVPLALALPPLLAELTGGRWMFATLLGLCAASSLAVPGDASGAPPGPRARFVGLGVITSVVLAGFLLGVVHQGRALPGVLFVVEALAITLLTAAAASLLLTRPVSVTEERVFALAAVLLIGGVADYLSLSALLGGVVAGAFWQLTGGLPRDSLRRDALYVQHSLLVLVLVAAGARTDLSLAAAVIAAAYLALRTAASLLCGALAGRIAGGGRDVPGLQLLSPGVFGVALAFGYARAGVPAASLLLSAVVLGSIASELVAEFARFQAVPPSERDRAVAAA
jgi:hypothetical protein